MARNARFILSFFVLIFSGLTHGQTEPVVVTATRTAQTVDALLAPVSVIDREEIEALQPVTVLLVTVTLLDNETSTTASSGLEILPNKKKLNCKLKRGLRASFFVRHKYMTKEMI